MRLRCAIAFAFLSTAAFAGAQTTAPSASPQVELRADEAFNQGQYVIALPMLQKVATGLKADPKQADKLAMVNEQIRVCQKNLPPQLASAMPSPAAVSAVGPSAALPAAGPVDPLSDPGPNRVPHQTPAAGQIVSLEIKQLGNFEYDPEKGGNIPADVLKMNGATVRLHGFMIPMDQAENISQFALVPSLFACCYGQPPQIQHTIVVNCPKGKAVSYFSDEIVVTGTLTVKEKRDDGFIVSVFEMQAASVKPSAK